MKKYFMTFGGPTSNFHDAVKKICKQAKKIDLFDEIIEYTDIDIKTEPEFWGKHGSFIENKHRGYGYWIWKPYLILKTLNKMKNGDLLLFADCGCEINYCARQKMKDLLKKMDDKVLLGTSAGHNIEIYTKMDTIKYIGDNLNTKNLMMQAGILLLKKTDIILNLISEWCELNSNYHLADDSSSVLPNVNGFIEHRHDGSILSLLAVKYGLINYDIEPTGALGNWGIGCHNKINLPIWAPRNKSGVDLIKGIC